jgi:hypothetical protein
MLKHHAFLSEVEKSEERPTSKDDGHFPAEGMKTE